MSDDHNPEFSGEQKKTFAVSHTIGKIEYRFGCCFGGPLVSKATFVENAQAKGYLPPSTSRHSKCLSMDFHISPDNGETYYKVLVELFLQDEINKLILLPKSRLSFDHSSPLMIVKKDSDALNNPKVAAPDENDNIVQPPLFPKFVELAAAVFEAIPYELNDLAAAVESNWSDLQVSKGLAYLDLPVSMFSDHQEQVMDSFQVCRILQRYMQDGASNSIPDHYLARSTADGNPVIQWRGTNGGNLTEVRAECRDTVRIEVSAPNRAAVRKLLPVSSGRFGIETACGLGWNLMVASKPIFEATSKHVVNACCEQAATSELFSAMMPLTQIIQAAPTELSQLRKGAKGAAISALDALVTTGMFDAGGAEEDHALHRVLLAMVTVGSLHNLSGTTRFTLAPRLARASALGNAEIRRAT